MWPPLPVSCPFSTGIETMIAQTRRAGGYKRIANGHETESIVKKFFVEVAYHCERVGPNKTSLAIRKIDIEVLQR